MRLLITFFDSKEIIHKEFVLSGQTLTVKYYLKILKGLMTRIRRIQLQYRDPESWSLLFVNESYHNSTIVRQYLARNQIHVLNHLPYLQDLAPCDFCLYQKLKMQLKGCLFTEQNINFVPKNGSAPDVSQARVIKTFQALCKKEYTKLKTSQKQSLDFGGCVQELVLKLQKPLEKGSKGSTKSWPDWS